MNIQIRPAAVMTTLALTLFSGAACAAQPYVGLSRTTPGEYFSTFSSGASAESYNHPTSLKLYGGMAITERYGIEIGYGAFGTLRVADPTPGSTEKSSFSPKMLYVAGRAHIKFGESWTVFGKLGLAANRISGSYNGQALDRKSFTRPMAGFGLEYAITNRVSGVVEYNYYGASGNFKQQKMEAGVKFAF